MDEQGLEKEMIALDDPRYVVVNKGIVQDIRDKDAYAVFHTSMPVFHPYAIDMDIHSVIGHLLNNGNITLVDSFRLSILKTALLNVQDVPGEIWEAGVYRGGSARFLAELVEKYYAYPCALRLFDTFGGMPETDLERDIHRAGDFADTSVELVEATVGKRDFVTFHAGLVPDTFAGLESTVVRMIHIDLDIYEAIKAAVAFAYPRMPRGGMIVFDDYGFASCPGARMAVDEFFDGKPERPFVLPTGQAIVTKK